MVPSLCRRNECIFNSLARAAARRMSRRVPRLRIGRDAEFWRGEDDGGCECIRIESCPKEVFSGNGIIDATTPTRVKVAKRDKRY